MAQENNADQGMSLEALMGATLGDLPELNAIPPAGMYTARLKLSVKKINNVNSIEAEYKIVECVDQDDPEAKPAKKDDKFNELFMTNNEIGLGRFQKLAATIMEGTGVSTVGEVLGGGPYDVMIQLKHRKSKNSDDVYPDVKKCELV